ncbi:hypothetical protein DEJ49_22625 [Streptomyces venezuelae]|uniref:Uncharacterized protein n=1 Tax=Streptomyces venezuelae TaxID=54571 RepID=A0A5P2CKL6_STRVZ|nr:hypothetical protein [Streptomyces venezuelae]QES43412.1 hypothetical protein DEJ49_22625 [Streptomyces venezuelae]
MKTDEQPTITGYDRRMYAIMNRREGAALHATAARRRAVVGTHIVLTAAGIACWLYSVLGDDRWATFGLIGVLLPWCVATGVINGATRGLLELRVHALDERQRAEKDRVAARAQHVMMWLLLAAAVGTGLAGFAGVEIEGLIFPVLFSVFVVHWLMPLWLAGLMAADDLPEDDLSEDDTSDEGV